MMKRTILFWALFFLLDFCVEAKAKISLVELGILQAKSGAERFEILLLAHQKAVRDGVDVDYSGIKQIDLEIPENAQSIPLSRHNDFCNVIFNVKNCSKDIVLFQTNYKLTPIEVTGRMVKRGKYPGLRQLSAKQPVLLIIEDKEPWVQKRDGDSYTYGVTRKEALLVERGGALNSTIAGYHHNSKVDAYYRVVDIEGTTFCNLVFNRTASSTKKTFLFKIQNESGVIIKNVVVNTPASELTGDVLMAVNNSTNVSFTDVSINNTYSSETSFGYGINMNNVTNASFVRFEGFGNWGVFGTYSLNTVFLKDCKLNRFDIHCYGRDVTCDGCDFRELYNQFSSFFGFLRFKSCTFTDFIPVAIEMSFNAYTGFDVSFEDCVFNATSRNHALISAGRLDNTISSRPELSEKCWPNVYIKNLTINARKDSNPIYIYRIYGAVTYPEPIGFLSSVKIDGVNFNLEDGAYPIKEILISSVGIETKNKLHITVRDVDLGIGEIKKGNFKINIHGTAQKDRISSANIEANLINQ